MAIARKNIRIITQKTGPISHISITKLTVSIKLSIVFGTRVCAYASRGLRASEKNCPAHKLEFLCLKWAVTEKFHDYLYGNQFDVCTDNNPLTYVLTSAKLNATGHRRLAARNTCNFSLKYKSGKFNGDADGLSRKPHKEVPLLPDAV